MRTWLSHPSSLCNGALKAKRVRYFKVINFNFFPLGFAHSLLSLQTRFYQLPGAEETLPQAVNLAQITSTEREDRGLSAHQMHPQSVS